MTNETFTYSFRVTGMERKQIVNILAETLCEEVSYSGAPSFGYQVGDWMINRESVVTTPKIQKDILRTVLDALKTAGAISEGNAKITLSLEGHTGNSLRNAVNLIWCKQSLIQKAVGRREEIFSTSFVNALNAVPIDSVEDFLSVIDGAIEIGAIESTGGLTFDQALSFEFFKASLDADEVISFITLCWQISEQAKKQKFSSTKQKESSNECYSMRCYLLKLGFIGPEFKVARKVLLSRLEGNASYRTIEALQTAEVKRKARTSEVLIERGESNE